MEDLKIGFCMCGSFCTMGISMSVLQKLRAANYDIVPIMSDVVYSTSTRFGDCEYFKENAPRGEFVLIVEGASAAEHRVYTVDEAVSLARALQEDGLSASAAAKAAFISS